MNRKIKIIFSTTWTNDYIIEVLQRILDKRSKAEQRIYSAYLRKSEIFL